MLENDDVNPEQSVAKVETLRSDMSEILRALVIIESHERTDKRSYTSLDLIEGLNIIRHVIKTRLSEGALDEWKNDHKNKYTALFNSITEEAKTAVELAFQVNGSKPPRFVHTYTTLLLDRVVGTLSLLGPDAATMLVDPIIDSLIVIVEETESENIADLDAAKKKLATFRKGVFTKRAMTKAERGDLIQSLFERLQQAA